MSNEIERHEAAAKFSGETAGKEFRDAVVAAAGFVAAGFIAREAVELVIPESSFREAAANSVSSIGLTVGAVVFAAGSLTAAKWRRDEIVHRRTANKLRNTKYYTFHDIK